MSDKVATPLKSKEKSHKKKKERSEKNSSRKRRRIEEAEETLASPQPSKSSPTKKRRRAADETTTAPTAKDAASEAPAAKRHSSIFRQTASLYVAVPPICFNYPLEGACAEHLSPLLLTYYEPLEGVILSYTNPRISEDPKGPSEPPLAKFVNEYGTTFIWLTADFTVFKPRRGLQLSGWVNLQNESHLGLIVWNLFSASIERSRLPKDWTWVEKTDAMETDGDAEEAEEDQNKPQQDATATGYFVDGQGTMVQGFLQFTLRDFDVPPPTEGEEGFISLEGTLLTDGEEKALEESEASRVEGKNSTRDVSYGSNPVEASSGDAIGGAESSPASKSKEKKKKKQKRK